MNSPPKDIVEKWRKPTFFISITAMLAGVLFSRAVLSSGLIFFALISLFHGKITQQLKSFIRSPLFWSMSLLFLLPAISGLWSENVSQWLQILRIKLPLLILPLCFAGENNFKFRDWTKISFVFLVLMFVAVCQSAWGYVQNMSAINAAYLKAYTMETPLGNDHVRFSLLVVIAIFTIIFLLVKAGDNFKKITRVTLFILAVIDIVYLHMLAVRTGLICFYFGVLIFLVWLLSHHRRKSFFLVALFLFLPVAAYFVFPTFKNKVSYLRYDLSSIEEKTYVPGSSDGNRFVSFKAGWALLRQHPVTGVGFGDIEDETDEFYEANFPQMSGSDKILPSSEWMMYGSGTGWFGIILFSFVMLIPFFLKVVQKNIFWILLNIFIAVSYLFDIGLEVQFGVFIHAFITLWWYKWLQLKE
jgi:O-antigen ligase